MPMSSRSTQYSWPSTRVRSSRTFTPSCIRRSDDPPWTSCFRLGLLGGRGERAPGQGPSSRAGHAHVRREGSTAYETTGDRRGGCPLVHLPDRSAEPAARGQDVVELRGGVQDHVTSGGDLDG